MELWRSALASCSGFGAVFNEIDETIRRLRRKGSSNTAPDDLQENDKTMDDLQENKKAVNKEGMEDSNKKTWVDDWIDSFSLDGVMEKKADVSDKENLSPGRRYTSETLQIKRITEFLANDLIDSCTLGACFRAHRNMAKANGRFEGIQPPIEHPKKLYNLSKMVTKCLNCGRLLGATYYASHLSSCLNLRKRTATRNSQTRNLVGPQRSTSQKVRKSPYKVKRNVVGKSG